MSSLNKYTDATSVTYLEYVSPVVNSKRQEVVIYCDLSSEVDFVMHFIIFKLNTFGLFYGFVMSLIFP
jgi:hypothetical protein